MQIKSSKYSVLTVITTLLVVMAVLPLSSCSNNNSTRSIASTESVNAPTVKDSERFLFIGNGRFGYIDRTGKIIIPAKFDDARNFSEGLASVSIGEKWGYIGPSGKIVIPARYDYPPKGKGGMEGSVSIPYFSASANFDRGLAPVVIPGSCRLVANSNACDQMGYIDKIGKLVFEF
jgi:WG containing repeat